MLTIDEWLEVERLVGVLKPFNKYTQKLQAVNCTLSDFFGFWIAIRRHMEKNDHPLKLTILTEMQARESQLLDNPILLAAIYLDPRFQCFLCSGKKEIASALLRNVHLRLQNVR